MKKFTLLVLFTVLHTSISYSQLTYVPDDNFEQYLINQGYDFGIPNDYVPTANINSITILNVDDKGITDLTGIEDFTALTELRCYTNSITNLDLSANTQLIYLHCSANSLTSLDVSANTQLQFLNCSINAIGSLNLNQNSLLSNFDASNNQLTGLSIVNGAGNIITNFNAINNPNLTCIQVDNATYSTNNWTDIDATSSFSTDCHYGETYVPDDNFEQALIDLGYDSGSLDDYVPTNNINTITSLYVDNEGISDLTGIEDFVDLTNLVCYSNSLTSLDVSNNTALTYLLCNDNNLTNLDLSNNTALTSLNCNSNSLTSLDVSNNTLLEYLGCYFNNLTSLNVSNNTLLDYLSCYNNNLISLDISNNTLLDYLHCSNNDLTSLNLTNNPLLENLNCGNNELIGINLKNGSNTIITSFNTINNSNLTCIQVENATYSTTNWTTIDSQTSFSEDCHYGETYVPDNNFEQALIDLGYDTGALDDYVQTANINTLTSLDIDSKSISDLTGIEDFVALTSLICSNNTLTSLDISNNTLLEDFNCQSNNLSSLDVSNNNLLAYLYCDGNNLTNLDVSNNNALTFLYCSGNTLANLDVSNNTALTTLNCSSNSLLSNLNVKNGNNTIITTFNATLNPNLTCIEVDNTAYSATNWTDIDAQTSFSENCNPITYVPDDNFEQALIDLGYDTGALDNYVPTNNINTLSSLDVDNEGISDLTGIEDFVALTSLTCSNNSLTSLDISNNILLEDLECQSNSLTSLDVSNNTVLATLNCFSNNITSLDATNNTVLRYFNCFLNDLTILNFKNGNNTFILDFNATNNPNLTCIQVDDAAFSTSNWAGIDATASFSENCHLTDTYIPDDNFEQALIDLGIDSGGVLDDYVPTADINTVTSLDVSSKSISDLTGIEDFVTLTTLNCSTNNLTNLDISNNTLLNTLYCLYNNLTSIDVSNNLELTYISLRFNQLTSLDVTNNLSLLSLTLRGNTLTSLDVSNNTNLRTLAIGVNNLTSLDLSNNTALDDLRCANNNLTSLDVSNNTALENFVFSDNSLTSIDLSNNTDLTTLRFSNNNLTSLDASNNTALGILDCRDNNLTSLNVKNGNNTSVGTADFDATNNPNLICIEVDDVTFSDVIWTNIDAQTSFSEDCSSVLNLEDTLVLENAVTIYPNPASDIIYLDSTIELNKIVLYDLLGKEMLSTQETSQIKVDNIPSGMYLLKIFSKNGFTVKQVIIK